MCIPGVGNFQKSLPPPFLPRQKIDDPTPPGHAKFCRSLTSNLKLLRPIICGIKSDYLGCVVTIQSVDCVRSVAVGPTHLGRGQQAPYALGMRTLLRSTLGENIHCDRRRPTRPRFDSRHNSYMMRS
jgi:hypothetical protein